MPKGDYAEKLKDPRWQKKRLLILERDQWTCQQCYDTESTLVVHHRRYLPDVEPWDYPENLLITLCKDCHEEERIKIPDIESDIIEILKEKFLASDIKDIATGFIALELPHTPQVTASMIRWVLSDSTLLIELKDRYWKQIHAEAEAKLQVKHA